MVHNLKYKSLGLGLLMLSFSGCQLFFRGALGTDPNYKPCETLAAVTKSGFTPNSISAKDAMCAYELEQLKKPSPNPNKTPAPSLSDKTEQDIVAKRESYAYRLALPNSDFSKLLYAYNTLEEVDFKGEPKKTAQRELYSGLWLFDRSSGTNERLPEELQLNPHQYPAHPILWIDRNRILMMGDPEQPNQSTSSLFIVDLVQKKKQLISSRLITRYFLQGPYLYFLSTGQVFQYHLQTGQLTGMPLPPALTAFPQDTYMIYPYRGDEILISKFKLQNQKGNHDFSIQLSPRANDSVPPLLDYYLYDTNLFKGRLLAGAADLSNGIGNQAVLFSPNSQRYALLDHVYEAGKTLPVNVKGTPLYWLSDQHLLSVEMKQEVPGGPPNVVDQIHILDIDTGTQLGIRMPASCYNIYKAEHNRILANCGGGQVYHLTGTVEQPGQFEALFKPPTYASLGQGNSSKYEFNELAPIFINQSGPNHFADIMGIGPKGELISKFKLLPPKMPDFVFDARAKRPNGEAEWKLVLQ